MAYRAWIIAPKGRGTAADQQALDAALPKLHLDCRPAEVVRVAGTTDVVDKGTVFNALKGLAEHEGQRLVWVVGDAVEWLDELCLETEDREPGLRLEKIWELLAAAAKAQPAAALIAVVDVCHAAPRQADLPDNLVAFAACKAHQKARADDTGGWLTQHLLRGLAELPGDVTAHDLQGWLDRCRTKEGVGDMRPLVHLGDRAGLVLNKRPAARGRPRSAPPAPAVDPIAAWRDHMRALHSDLFPIFDAAAAADEVFVELELAPDERMMRRADLDLPDKLTLGTLMERPAGRWAVLGEPGAGKSTLARHLTWELADDPDGPVPVYLSLPGFARSDAETLFDYAALLLKQSNRGKAAAPVLAAALLQVRPLYLLLDGLDEVGGPALDAVRTAIRCLPTEVPHAHIAVFSRVIGFDALAGFRRVRVRPLDPDRQRNLLTRWLVDEALAERAWARLQTNANLQEVAGTPLLLTLIALLYREHEDLPPTRVALYRGALDVLFERGYSATRPEPMPKPAASRRVLRHLSLALQSRGGEAWPADELARTLRLLEADKVELEAKTSARWVEQQKGRGKSKEEGADHAARLTALHLALHGDELDRLGPEIERIAEDREDFLQLLAGRTGVLAPHDGRRQPWRYLHRALRDALCAEQLLALLSLPHGERALIALAETLDGDDLVGRWAETFAQLCAGAAAPVPLLKALAGASDGLGRRALAEVDGLPASTLVELLLETDWDGEDLLRLARRWRDQPRALQVVRDLAHAAADLETCARVHYALATVGRVDHAEFFRRIGRPMPATCPIEAELVSIAAGSFRGERPRETPVRAFELGATTVTRKQFAAFDPSHDCPGGDDHPVTNVSWYIARLFCIWAGGRLPTETEWEYACRAGSEAAYCFGDDPEQLGEYAWYSAGNIGEVEPQPVRGKTPNAWCLYDMHGNVDEWCADWYGDYSAEPAGPATGVFRVLRGGSAWNTADFCRSAFRGRGSPWYRSHNLGFRLARSPRPSRS